ncbi:MAG: hypothetical protein GF350_08260 [Chitinivibrionales bacterium]|nr:hypothetical protein [Chitinivibrionales bacterium]
MMAWIRNILRLALTAGIMSAMSGRAQTVGEQLESLTGAHTKLVWTGNSEAGDGRTFVP